MVEADVCHQNLRDEVAMDVDEDEESTQRVKRVPDYGIEVDFDRLKDGYRDVSLPPLPAPQTYPLTTDEQGDAAETLKEIDEAIGTLAQEIEQMAPNLKAIDRLDDVEAKLMETEKEADKARKDSKNARDQFNEIKRKRCAPSLLRSPL